MSLDRLTVRSKIRKTAVVLVGYKYSQLTLAVNDPFSDQSLDLGLYSQFTCTDTAPILGL